METSAVDSEECTRKVLDACFEVHRHLGPGLLESVYEECLVIELLDRGLDVRRQIPLPVVYKSRLVSCPLRLDILVEDTVVVEIKAIERFHPVHLAQVISYLKLARCPCGLLVNFNVPLLKDGIRRVFHGKPRLAEG